MTQVAYVGSGTRAANTNGNVTPALPAGLSTGDLLIAVGAIAAPARNYTAPAGWSSTTYATNTSTDGPRIFIATKLYAPGDTAPLLTAGGTSKSGGGVLAQVHAFRNATGTPTFGTPYTSGATAGTDAGAISGVTPSGLGMAVAVAAWADDFSSDPTLAGWTLAAGQETTASPVNVSTGVFYKELNNTGSGNVTVTGSPTAAATRSGIQIALHEISTDLNRLAIGDALVDALAIGDSTVSAVYVGDTQVWP